VIDVWILYEAFFKAFLDLPFKVAGGGSSIVWISLIWAAIGAVWATFALKRGRNRRRGSLYAIDGEPAAVAAGSTHRADELV